MPQVLVNPNDKSVSSKHADFVGKSPGFIRFEVEESGDQPIERLSSFHRLGAARKLVRVSHLLLNLKQMVPSSRTLIRPEVEGPAALFRLRRDSLHLLTAVPTYRAGSSVQLCDSPCSSKATRSTTITYLRVTGETVTPEAASSSLVYPANLKSQGRQPLRLAPNATTRTLESPPKNARLSLLATDGLDSEGLLHPRPRPPCLPGPEPGPGTSTTYPSWFLLKAKKT